MTNDTLKLEMYKKNLINKQKLDDGLVTLEELTEEEIDGVSELYENEIEMLYNAIKQKEKNIESLKKQQSYLIEMLEEENNLL